MSHHRNGQPSGREAMLQDELDETRIQLLAAKHVVVQPSIGKNWPKTRPERIQN